MIVVPPASVSGRRSFLFGCGHRAWICPDVRRSHLRPSNVQGPLVILAAAHWLVHFFAVLLARHWFVGLSNLGLTALLGLALLKAAGSLRFRAQTLLRLRRLVLLAALFKGALYLVLGESMYVPPHHRWFVGIQIPDPSETVGLVAQTGYSVWHPTAITGWVTLALSLTATAYLIVRGTQLLLAKRCLETIAGLSHAPADPRVDRLMRQACRTLGAKVLPRVIQVDLPEWGIQSRCPLIVGLRDPLILFSPILTGALNDAEIEMVFRHEIAHLIRRDHWWRWLLLWVADVGGLIVLNAPVKAAAIDLEEQLCDRLAVRTPREAVALAAALRKTIALMQVTEGAAQPLAGRGVRPRPSQHAASAVNDHTQGNGRGMPTPPKSAVPLLLGAYAASWQDLASLRARLTALFNWSRELSAGQASEIEGHGRTGGRHGRELWVALLAYAGHALRGTGRLVLLLLLCLVLYTKFYLGPNLR